MDFTREPIIETIITPKEGFKLVVRSSKSTAQEEYFVDALEVVSFGNSFFFRSIERPKSFLVPVCDYEVLEVRETRMVLKNVGIDKSIKIGGGREKAPKIIREVAPIEKEPLIEPEVSQSTPEPVESTIEGKTDGKGDKKKDRRRHYRRRRNREDGSPAKEGDELLDDNGEPLEGDQGSESPRRDRQSENGSESGSTTSFISSLLPPPPTLISETIARYKDNALFKGAFYSKEELAQRDHDNNHSTHAEPAVETTSEQQAQESEDLDLGEISLEESSFGSFHETEETNEETLAPKEDEEQLEHSSQAPASTDTANPPHHDPDDHDHYVF